MLRCCAARCRLLRAPDSVTRLGLCARHSSSRAGMGTGTKVLAGSLFLGTGAVGGTLGYAASDPEFRALLESQVPGADQALDLILGPVPLPPPKPSAKTLAKLKIPSSVVVTEPKVEENTSAPLDMSPPLPVVEEPPPAMDEVIIVEEIPPAVEDFPPLVEEIPPLVEESPQPVEEIPSSIEETPQPVEEISPPVEETPQPVEEIPPLVEDVPPPIEDVPPPIDVNSPVEDVQSTVDVSPADVSPSVEDVPPAVEDVPLSAEEVVAPREEVPLVDTTPNAEQSAEVSPVEDVPPVVPVVDVPLVVDVPPAEEDVPPSSEDVLPPKEEVPSPVDDVSPPAEEVPPQVEDVPLEDVPPLSEEPKEIVTESIAALSLGESSELMSDEMENSSLNAVLTELTREMKASVEKAVAGYEMSTDAVLNHINIMQKVLESDIAVTDDTAWNTMFEAAMEKSDAVKAAEIREKEAIAAIDNVIEMISSGRKNRATSSNLELVLAEEAANKAIYHLDQSKIRGSAIGKEARVMEEYKNLVEAGRKQFHREMASIMPDVKLGEKSGKLTEDELNMFITHAYRKVLFLQQQLAKQQTLEQEKFKKAVEKHREDIQRQASVQIDEEVDRQTSELEEQHRQRLEVLREEAEAEMRAQLRRQAAAHSDHLADVVSVQEAELSRNHSRELDEKLSSARTEYVTSLAGLSGTVSGITSSLQARAMADRASMVAQSLWLACTGLNTSLSLGQTEAVTWEGKMKPLAEEVGKIKGVVGEGDEFVDVVLSTISPVALERGVYTEDSLKERFCKVEKVARRVANIGDDGGSLLSYGLSYLQSLLLVDLSQRTPSDSEEPLSITDLSPNELVDLAKFSLDRSDLARAVQYVTLLRGEPGRVARDWLEEARLTLETKQAAEVLLSHAESKSVETLPAV